MGKGIVGLSGWWQLAWPLPVSVAPTSLAWNCWYPQFRKTQAWTALLGGGRLCLEERRKDDLTKVEPIPGYGHMKFLEDDWQGSPTEVFWSRDWPMQC